MVLAKFSKSKTQKRVIVFNGFGMQTDRHLISVHAASDVVRLEACPTGGSITFFEQICN